MCQAEQAQATADDYATVEGTSNLSFSAKKNLSWTISTEVFQLYSPIGELYCFAVIFGLRRVIFASRVLEGEYNITVNLFTISLLRSKNITLLLQNITFLQFNLRTTRSAKKKHTFVYQDNVCFFQRNKSLTGFVKCTSCVKYASRVKCAAARDRGSSKRVCELWGSPWGDLFHFTLRPTRAIFHNFRKEIISHSAKPNISLALPTILCYTNPRKAVGIWEYLKKSQLS